MRVELKSGGPKSGGEVDQIRTIIGRSMGARARKIAGDARAIFDAEFYRRANPDVAATGADPLTHYLQIGWAEGRNPSPLFDNDWYFEQNPDVAKAGLNPLLHYLSAGASEGREPSPLFDGKWYLEQYPDVAKAGVNPLIHYLTAGAAEERNPNPLFDTAWYWKQHAQVHGSDLNPLAHYVEYGAGEGLAPHPLFDGKWYLEKNPDVAAAGENPLAHYLTAGRLEGRAPKAPAEGTVALSRNEVLSRIKSAPPIHADQPLVSVIIPAYQNLDYTLRCLLSILQAPDETPFEILIVDDCSPDGSGQVLETELSGIKNVHVYCNETNLGFLKSCNGAAARSRSDYLFFLNNDTTVNGGWLDELINVFQRIPDAGLAGSKLIYPDGRLQEAGGIVWNDASGANYGRLGDPQAPQYNYERDADYISGAAILVPRAVWEAVGGFSEEFAPAYYEDTDLAMKIRAAGKRVIYQPLSTVVHHEGVTSGTDITKGVKRHQAVNKEKFLTKWRDALSTFGSPADFSKPIVDRRSKGRILIFDAETPTPDKDCGSIKAVHYMRILSELGYRVTFVPENLQWGEQYSRDLQRLGVEVIYLPYAQKSSRQYVLDNGHEFDLFILSRATIGGMFFDEVKSAFPDKPIIFDTVDIHHLRLMRQFELERDFAVYEDAKQLRKVELNAIRRADATIVVSDFEVEYLRSEIGPFPGVVIPLMYEPFERTTGFEDRADIAFIGGYRHTPNVDAVKYLMNEIWPKFRRFNSGAKLHIIGSHMPASFAEYACDDIVVAGFVEDLEAYLQNIRMTIAPLRYGAGVKGKVGNSLRMGVPVVATPVAAEGMGLVDGEHVLVERDADRFAQAMHRLYTDVELWETLSRQGQEFVMGKFGIENASAKLGGLCRMLIGG